MSAEKRDLLKCVKAHIETAWSVCAAVWELILSQEPEKQRTYFFTFLSQIFIEDMGVEDETEFLSSNTFNLITEDIDRLANRVIANLVRQRLPERSFYENLWAKISDSTLLPDKDAQTAFLTRLWIDPRIPYYQVGEGCTMANEEFVRIRDEVWPVIKRADFLLSVPFKQKTQRASLIMWLADELQDDREKAVFWACVMAHVIENSRASERSDI